MSIEVFIDQVASSLDILNTRLAALEEIDTSEVDLYSCLSSGISADHTINLTAEYRVFVGLKNSVPSTITIILKRSGIILGQHTHTFVVNDPVKQYTQLLYAGILTLDDIINISVSSPDDLSGMKMEIELVALLV